jgi:hypothetical protein
MIGRATILLLFLAVPLRAQGGSPRVDMTLPDRVVAGTDVPMTTMTGLLSEGHRRELLNSGFPTSIHARVELWKKGLLWFNRESVVEWDIVVEYSPATGIYHVRRVSENTIEDLGQVRTIDDAEVLLRRPFRARLTPRSHGGRYFYVFAVDVSTLSYSDLEAWQAWVRGEAQPAVQGKKNPATAVQRGLGSLLSRVLGGETQSYERRSAVFTAG